MKKEYMLCLHTCTITGNKSEIYALQEIGEKAAEKAEENNLDTNVFKEFCITEAAHILNLKIEY